MRLSVREATRIVLLFPFNGSWWRQVRQQHGHPRCRLRAPHIVASPLFIQKPGQLSTGVCDRWGAAEHILLGFRLNDSRKQLNHTQNI